MKKKLNQFQLESEKDHARVLLSAILLILCHLIMKKVFFLLVKRLQELQCHKNHFNNTKESKPLLQIDQNVVGDKLTDETINETSMGANVTTTKGGGLSGRRTQSQSKFLHVI